MSDNPLRKVSSATRQTSVGQNLTAGARPLCRGFHPPQAGPARVCRDANPRAGHLPPSHGSLRAITGRPEGGRGEEDVEPACQSAQEAGKGCGKEDWGSSAGGRCGGGERGRQRITTTEPRRCGRTRPRRAGVAWREDDESSCYRRRLLAEEGVGRTRQRGQHWHVACRSLYVATYSSAEPTTHWQLHEWAHRLLPCAQPTSRRLCPAP